MAAQPEAGTAVLARSVARPLTPTERNWIRSLLIVFGSVLLFWAVMGLEEALGRTAKGERLVYNGVETSMRLFGLSHFLVAILFLVTARRMRTVASWSWLLGLAGLGVVLCFGYDRLLGLDMRLARVLFLAYFLVHEFRDETFFYVANGDAKAAGPGPVPKRDLWVAPLLLLAGLVAVGAAGTAFRIGGMRRYAHLIGDVEGPLRWALGILPAVLVMLAVHAVRARLDRRFPGGAAGFVRAHRPIFFVFLGIPLLIAFDALTFGAAYMIVTLHVVAWYVFTMHQLKERAATAPSPARPLTWAWVRSTPAGFNTLHLGLVALVVAAGIVWAYGFKNDPGQGALYVLLDRGAFPYWTIMHVTISFVPR